MIKKYKLPKGVKDFLPEEYSVKVNVESQLIDCFESYGYKRIDTPTLEYAELFSGGNIASKKLFKLTDSTGELLALRNDMTTPIARIISTKLEEGTYRLCYTGKCFDFLNSNLREFTQVGVELIGNASADADSEVVIMAIESLLKAGIVDFQIDLGNTAFFKGLLSSMSLTAEQSDELISYVEKRDTIGEEIFAINNSLSQDFYAILKKLPFLFGGREVLDEAYNLCLNDQMRNALDRLGKTYDLLKTLGYEKYIAFDLSLVDGMGYYTGLVFQGITKYFGSALLSGGRYDDLCGSFDKNIPAVGFAMTVEDVMRALAESNYNVDKGKKSIIFACENTSKEAFELMKEYREKGYIVSNSFVSNKDELIKLKKQNNCDIAIYIDSKLKQEKF